MSRALNLDVTRAEIEVAAAKRGARITAIEPLFPSGTRVVFSTSDAAAIIAKTFKTRVLTGPVTRTPLRVR